MRTVAPHSRVEAIPADELPSLPWAVEARSSSGATPFEWTYPVAGWTSGLGPLWQDPRLGPALRAIAICDRVAVDIAVDRVRPLV